MLVMNFLFCYCYSKTKIQLILTWGVLLRQNIPGCYQLKDNLQKSGNNNDGTTNITGSGSQTNFFLRLAMLPGLDR